MAPHNVAFLELQKHRLGDNSQAPCLAMTMNTRLMHGSRAPVPPQSGSGFNVVRVAEMCGVATGSVHARLIAGPRRVGDKLTGILTCKPHSSHHIQARRSCTLMGTARSTLSRPRAGSGTPDSPQTSPFRAMSTPPRVPTLLNALSRPSRLPPLPQHATDELHTQWNP